MAANGTTAFGRCNITNPVVTQPNRTIAHFAVPGRTKLALRPPNYSSLEPWGEVSR